MQSPEELLGFEYSQAPGTEPSVGDITKLLLLDFPQYARLEALDSHVAREVQRAVAGSRIMAPETLVVPVTPVVGGTVRKRGRDVVPDAGSGAPSGPIGGVKLRSPLSNSPCPLERFSDVCGLDQKSLFVVRNQVIQPLVNSALCGRFLKSMPCPGVLICGSPGSGKTLLARAIAGESSASFFPVSSTEIVAGISGESEEKIRQIFEAAKNAAPSIIVFDDIDVICPRSANRDLERRIVAQIQNCMDALAKWEGYVAVVATTSKPEVIDSSLRRSGRFDIELSLGMPDLTARREILARALEKYFTASLCRSVDLTEVAKKAAGFVGADLIRLVRETGMCAVERLAVAEEAMEDLEEERFEEKKFEGKKFDGKNFEEKKSSSIDPVHPSLSAEVTMGDFLTALKYIEPSSRREGFSTVPSQTWEDVGSLETVKARLEQAVCLPIRRADLFAAIGGVPSGGDGVLLYGPPGCGKTLLAKAVANASGASFISVKGPELLNKYVGESERAVRQVFERARISPPCVIFFDEIDALCPRRDGSNGSSGAAERVVNQMLTEMDGAGESNKGVVVIGATNRPDMVDPAMLRPGRLGLLMYVPLPDETARENILRTLLRKTKVEAGIDLKKLAHATPRFSGADMACLVRSAVTQAVVRLDATPNPKIDQVRVQLIDFELARTSLRASVSADEEKKYLSLRDEIDKGVKQ